MKVKHPWGIEREEALAYAYRTFDCPCCRDEWLDDYRDADWQNYLEKNNA